MKNQVGIDEPKVFEFCVDQAVICHCISADGKQSGISWGSAMLQYPKRVKQIERRNDACPLQLQAQIEHHNHAASGRSDVDIHVSGSQSPEPPARGTGKWKCWKPQAAIRVGFADLVGGTREVVGRVFDSSNGHVVA